MNNLNYGQKPNDKVCGCGAHRGVGEWSPDKRAAVYGFQRDRLFPHMTDAQKYYLASWEERHGKVYGDWAAYEQFQEAWKKFLGERQQSKMRSIPDTRIYA